MIDDERDDTRRLEAAADWMLRLRDDVASDDEILRWMEWCEADPRNQRAFERVEKLWAVSAGVTASSPGAEPPRALPRRASMRFGASVRSPFLAAAVVAAVVAAVFAWSRLRPATLSDRDLVGVRSAELVREARLPDGSMVQLAAASTVAINYTDRERAVDLHHGEAFFAVTPDRNRPFVVAAGSARIRAVGTAFDVRRADARIVVTVTEGIVEVSRGGGANGASDTVTVSAGGQVRWGGGDPNPIVASVDPVTALGWRDGRLSYLSEPLGAVIADLNRYSKRPVMVGDERAGDLRFSGTLFTDGTAEWLLALPGILPVVVEERDGTWVVVARRADEKAR